MGNWAIVTAATAMGGRAWAKWIPYWGKANGAVQSRQWSGDSAFAVGEYRQAMRRRVGGGMAFYRHVRPYPSGKRFWLRCCDATQRRYIVFVSQRRLVALLTRRGRVGTAAAVPSRRRQA